MKNSLKMETQKEILKSIVKDLNGKSFFKVPAAMHTSFAVGGIVGLVYKPSDESDLICFLKNAKEACVAVTVIGKGTNVLISDHGIQGALVVLAEDCSRTEWLEDGVISQAGISLGKLIKGTINKSFGGLEQLSGIPGTVGGAIIGNSGAYGSEISDTVVWVRAVNKEGKIIHLKKSEIGFRYRESSLIEKQLTIIEVRFGLVEAKKEKLLERASEIIKSRFISHPIDEKSAGCIFKNPSSVVTAGKLIEQANLKGFRIGGASVSKKHCNFIINEGNASASDIYELIKTIKNKIKDIFNIELKLEIKLLGDFY